MQADNTPTKSVNVLLEELDAMLKQYFQASDFEPAGDVHASFSDGNVSSKNSIQSLDLSQETNQQLSLDHKSTPEFEQMIKDEDEQITTPEQIRLMKRSKWRSRIIGFLFYSALIAIVAGLFFLKQKGDGLPLNLLGFSAMTVLTESMQSEIPQGSFIVTKHVEPSALTVDDNITFLKIRGNEVTTVTHKIIEIHKDYKGAGKYAFVTKGVSNLLPDPDVVYGNNIVGKVIFQSLFIGKTIKFLQKNWIFIIIITGILIALNVTLRTYFVSGRDKTTPSEKNAK
ncbi:MAG: signal peptidase I [Clostridiales bacterium]|jgi:signal peptidase|nr:signal peptidase I [Clostridiales bacterium]